MKRYEICYASVNSESYSKPITALVIEPDTINAATGAMLFTHGWGGNRFQHEDKMAVSADAYNLVCVSVEYRQSGYDFNPVTGLGAYLPYDASFYQVFDVLNGLREVLALRGGLNRSRLFHYGGSQGGHIALLSALYVPRTFGFIYASCPLTHLDSATRLWPGRSFNADELSIRNVLEHAGEIETPIYVEYGTADVTVDCEKHSCVLEKRLGELGKECGFKAYEGGGHDLMPTINKLTAFEENVPELMKTKQRTEGDDFLEEREVSIATLDNKLIIDWSQATDSVALFRWEKPLG